MKPQVGFDAARSKEDVSKRKADSTEFANPDGTRTLRVFGGTRFKESAGKLQPVETALERSANGRVRPRNAASVTFAGKGNDPELVAFDLGDGASVSFGLDSANPVGIQADDLTSAGRGQGKAAFKGIRPDADVEITAALWGVKEDLVLRSVNAPMVWDFTVKLTGGLRAELDPKTGAVLLKKPNGDAKGVIPPGFMTDSNIDPRSGEGVRSNGVKYVVSQQGGATKLRIELDAAWLKDLARRFPVVVDPSLRDNTDSDDTYVMSNMQPFPSWSESELKAGTYDGGVHVAASYLHFNEAFDNLRNHQIFGAALSVHEIYSFCCPAQARTLDVFRVTSPWGTEVSSWPGPSWDGAAVGTINASYGNTPAWLTIPIPSDRMTRWVHGLEGFHGFRLGASYSDSYGWKRFSSAQSPQAGNVPFLDVSYSVEGASYGLPTGGYTTPVTSVSDGTLPVNVTNWGASTWSAGGSFGLRQSLYNSAGEDMIDKLGLHNYRHSTVPSTTWSHGTVRIDVKTPKLPPGSYRLVLGMEQAGAGNYAPFSDVPRFEGAFTVPNTAPTIKGNHPANNALVDTLRPTLWVDYTDPDNWPNAGRNHWFELCGGTPQAPTGCVNSGWQSSPSWTPPTGPLSWSKTGHWYVKLSDNNTESGKLGPFALTPVVPQPEITSRLVGTSDGGDVPGVNPQAGNFGSTVVDVNVPVAGPPLSISRTYNSQDPRTAGAFGAGWTTPLDQRITQDSDGSGNVMVTLVTGLQLRFGRNPDGTYVPPPGINLTLVKTASDWTLRDARGTKRVFDTTGRLVKIHDSSDNTQSLVYNGTSTQVDKINDDASGRRLHLAWVGGHVVSVSTDAPQSGVDASRWTYTYDADRLTKVCAPLTGESCADYRYTESSHYRSVVLDANPTAYWTLGEANGSTANNLAARTAGEWNGTYQSVGQGKPGAIAGSTDFGVEFDATRNGAVTAPNGLLNKDMSFAVEVWFKAAQGKNGVLVSHQNTELGTNPWNYVPYLHVDTNGKLSGNSLTTSGIANMTSPARVDDGNWHHAVLTTAVDTHTLYLDGQQAGQVTGKTIDHEGNYKVVVGNGFTTAWPNTPSGYFPFTGAVDEVAVYRHILTPEQIAGHHRLRTSTHRLTQVVEPGDFTATSVAYDGQGGRVSSLTDRNGATWTIGAATPSASAIRTLTVKSTVRGDITYGYDTANGGRIIERKDQFGAIKWEYNAAGFVHRTLDETGWTKFTDTDARGNVIRRAVFQGGWSYRGYGYFLNANDPLDPRNDTLIWQTNGYGWGDEAVYRTSYTVDAAGRVTQVTYPKPAGMVTNPTETYRYSNGTEASVDGGTVPAGKMLSHTDQRGGITQYHYWRTGDLGSIVDPVGLRHEHAYDALGRAKARTESVNAGGTWTYTGTTHYAYNALSLPVEIKQPATTNAVTGVNHQQVTTYTYDRSGRRTEATVSDATGGDTARTTKYGYDAAGHLTSTTAPDQTATRQEWDTAGDVVKTIDAGNRVLEHRFDDRHLLVETAATGTGVDPLDTNSTRLVLMSRSYDPLGRLAVVVDAQGSERTYTYHGNGPLKQETHVVRDAAGAVTKSETLASYTYDGAGNVSTRMSAGARTSRYVHDDAGLLVGDVTGDNRMRAHSYTRDAMGNATTASAHTGVVFTSQDDAGFVDSDSPNTSQVDGTGARYADNDQSWVYAITLPGPSHVSGLANAFTGGKLSLKLSNQFLVEASSDRVNWTELGRESQAVTNRSNTGERTFDVGAFLSARTLYVRVRDSLPTDGWGGRVESARLELTDSAAPTSRTAFEYDAAGRKIKEIVDNPGATQATLATTLTRDPRGLITATTSPGGSTTTFGYDNADALVSATLPAVDTWVAGQQTTGVSPQATLGRNTFGEITEQRDPTGATSRTEYDAMGRAAKEISPAYMRPSGQTLTATTSYRYDERGLPIEVTDARGGVTGMAYDHYGRVVRTTAPDPDDAGPLTAPVTTHEYDRVGQLLKTADPSGGTTSATYDTRGAQLTSTVTERIEGQTVFFTTNYGRDSAGEVTSVTTPTGAKAHLYYTDAGELANVFDPTEVWDDREYDHSGRLLAKMIGEEIGESYRYDAAGRLVTQSTHTGTYSHYNPALRTTHNTYDADSRLTETLSAEGRVSKQSYDAAGRTTSFTQLADTADPASAVTVQLGHDAAGRTTRMVDGNGNVTDYTHNVWGLPESVVEPATTANTAATDRTWTTSYDLLGRPVTQTMPGGVTVERAFDALGRVVSESGSAAESATTTKNASYDVLGRPTKISGPNGDTNFTWNDRGLLTAANGAAGTASFDYDGDNRLTKRVDKAGTATFTYNDKGQLASLSDPLTGRTLGYEYDGNLGVVTSIGFGSGAATREFGYDELGRLDIDKLVKPGGAVATTTDYGYDRDDLITRKTTAGVTGEGLNTYGFDGLGRLTAWTRTDAAQETYTWDKASNRTAVTNPQGTRTTTYDARNRITTATGGGQPDMTATHTARGTLTRTTSSAATTEYRYDAFERMTEAKRGDQTTTYKYDALDRLVSRNGAAFSYSGLDNNPVAMPGGNSDTVVARDAAGTPFAERAGVGSARSLLTDTGHGDVTTTFESATGEVTGSRSYSPFGEQTATQSDPPSLGYQGGYTDPSTGQVNAHARWYDPALGAFTSRDTWTLNPTPVAQANRYAYGNGNPVNYSDPSGHFPWAIAGVVLAVVAIAAGTTMIAGKPVPAPQPQRIAPCSWCGMKPDRGNPTPSSQVPGLSNTTQAATPTPGYNTGYVPGGIGTSGKGHVTVPAPQPPVGVVNNSRPTPRPTAEQTLAGAHRPSASVGSDQGAIAVDNSAASGRQVPYQVGQATGHESTCGFGCQVDDFFSTLGNVAAESVGGVFSMAITAVECAKPFSVVRSRAECADAAAAVFGTVEFLVTDPAGFAVGLWDTTVQPIIDAENQGRDGAAVALAVGGIAEFAIGGKGAGKAARVRDMAGCGRNSFTGDTEVLMGDGSRKPISEVHAGDEVVATDPETGESGSRTVTATIIGQGTKTLVDVTVDIDGPAGDRTASITATDGHPFWVEDRDEWVDAEKLAAGDRLTSPDGATHIVVSIRARTVITKVYNLTVSGVHTYYVLAGTTPVLVHNCDPVMLYRAPEKGNRASESQGLDPANHPVSDGYGGTAYLGDSEAVAQQYAGKGVYEDGYHEFTMKSGFLDEFHPSYYRRFHDNDGGLQWIIDSNDIPLFNSFIDRVRWIPWQRGVHF